jgi:hypothetical protein
MEDTFKTREAQFEAMFAHDEELRFRIIAHRNKLFGVWAAAQLGEAAPPGYAETLSAFALGRHPAELVSRVVTDLQDHGVAIGDIRVWKALEHCHDESERDVKIAG